MVRVNTTSLVMIDDEEKLGRGGLNIAHLNVASILGAKKFEMLSKQVELSHFQVFCASETWGAFPTLFCGPPQTATAGSCKSVSAQYSR